MCHIRCLVLLATTTLVLVAISRAEAAEQIPVAVLEFQNTSNSPEYQSLERALREMLTTDLSRVREIRIVERARLSDLIAEMKLAQGGFVDPDTAAKLGKGVGARAVLVGSVFVRGGQMRIDARLVHVSSGKILLTEEMSGRADDFFSLEKKLANAVTNSLGITLTQLEKLELDEPLGRSFEAARRYGRALAFDDAGNLEAARRAAVDALKADPEFRLAKSLGERIGTILKQSEERDFKEHVRAIVDYESLLPVWPYAGSMLSYLGKFDPAEYERLWKQSDPNRALFYWVARLARTRFQDKTFADFYETTINHVGLPGVFDEYMFVGGCLPALFWSEVLASEPDLIPNRPVVMRDINRDILGMTPVQIYRMGYYRQYASILSAQMSAELCLGRLNDATKVAEKGIKLYGEFEVAGRFLRLLKGIKEVTESDETLAKVYRDRDDRQRLWRVAEGQIIEATAKKQDHLFSRFHSDSTSVKNLEGKVIRRAWFGIEPINLGVRGDDKELGGPWSLAECQIAVTAYPKSQRFQEDLRAARSGGMSKSRPSAVAAGNVVPSSPAAQAGILRFDIIFKIGDVRFGTRMI